LKKKNEREDLKEYLKNIKFVYQTNYKSQKAAENDKIKYKDNVHKILFCQNLKKEVED
jgi:CRISPR/Cas system CMR-associated protein Cmr5 small subunit